MKLTTKGRYAVTAMLDLALHAQTAPVSLADISERQGISISYLEQLFARLRKNLLVASVRGPGGGYRLSRDASSIFVAQVIDAVDEKAETAVDVVEGISEVANKVPAEPTSLTSQLWMDLSQQLHDFLSHISLQALVDRAEVRKLAEREDVFQQETRMPVSEAQGS